MLPKGTISRMMDYYFSLPEDKNEVLTALQAFYNRPDLGPGAKLEIGEFDEILFNEWFTFDFIFKDGKTMPEKYYDDNPHKLPMYIRQIYKYLQDNFYSFFKVLKVNVGHSMLLQDLRDNKEYLVLEYKGTFCVKPGFIIINRLVEIDNNYQLIGCDAPGFDSNEIPKDLESLIKEMLTPATKLTPKDVRRLF